MEDRVIKINAPMNNKIVLKVVPGHFATNNSHLNYYLDMTTIKSRQSEAKEVAKALKLEYVCNTIVDTIVCMDGCEVIGAYLAEELSEAGFMCRNAHKTIYIVTPEYNASGQMIFRDNLQIAIKDKHIILLVASATTGGTVKKSIECINYYGGNIQGVSAVFSAVDQVEGIHVDSVFKKSDVPNYETYEAHECPYCKKGHRIEAIVNSFGYSKL